MNSVTSNPVVDFSFSLDGRTAVVTGGGSGIGAAIAAAYAAKGATVAILDISLDAAQGQARRIGGDTVALECDVTDEGSVSHAVSLVHESFGRIDILVNCAGVVILGPAEDLTAHAWNTTLAVNLTGAFHMCQHVGRIMLDQGSGKVINLASQAASVALLAHAAYCASKFGLVGLTKVLASEWAPRGVTANTISHGGPDRPRPQGLGRREGRTAEGPDPHRPVRRARRDRCRCRLPCIQRRRHDQRRRPGGRRRVHHPLTRSRSRRHRLAAPVSFARFSTTREGTLTETSCHDHGRHGA